MKLEAAAESRPSAIVMLRLTTCSYGSNDEDL